MRYINAKINPVMGPKGVPTIKGYVWRLFIDERTKNPVWVLCKGSNPVMDGEKYAFVYSKLPKGFLAFPM